METYQAHVYDLRKNLHSPVSVVTQAVGQGWFDDGYSARHVSFDAVVICEYLGHLKRQCQDSFFKFINMDALGFHFRTFVKPETML